MLTVVTGGRQRWPSLDLIAGGSTVVQTMIV